MKPVRMTVDLAALEADEPKIREIQVSAALRRGLKALDSLTGLSPESPPWLHKLAILGKEKALTDRDVREAFVHEIQHSDPAPVFRVLMQPTPTCEDFKNAIARSEWLVLMSWLARDGAQFQFSFCYYTDRALAKLLWAILGLKAKEPGDYYREAKVVRKWWERLGLRKGKLLFKDVSVEGGVLSPVPYDKLRQR